MLLCVKCSIIFFLYTDLERKLSVRTDRQELIRKGILPVTTEGRNYNLTSINDNLATYSSCLRGKNTDPWLYSMDLLRVNYLLTGFVEISKKARKQSREEIPPMIFIVVLSHVITSVS